jgi:hypothetical protein
MVYSIWLTGFDYYSCFEKNIVKKNIFLMFV